MKNRIKNYSPLNFIIISLLISACTGSGTGSGGSSTPPPASAAPVISNLTYAPSSASVNEGNGTAYIVGSFDFSDTDGDVAQLRFTTSMGDDHTINLSVPSGTTSGTTQELLQVNTTLAGTADFSVRLIDTYGNSSNALTGSFSITQDLDTTFAQSGIVITDDAPSGYDEQANGIALQSDGKILLAGYIYNGLNNDVRVIRYNTDGSLDTTFANSGMYVYDSGANETAYAIGMQADGKFVVVGTINQFNAGNDNILVMRFNFDGTPDNTFGTNGVVTTNISAYGDEGYALAIQQDGKIIVAGEVAVGGTDVQALVLRYNSNGSLDTNFGTNGLVQYSDPANGWDSLHGIAVQSDGKIVTTGNSSSASATALTNLLVLRLNSNGTFDNTFANNGVYHYDDVYFEKGTSILVQSDGKIAIGGNRWSYASINNAALILRLNTDGTLDNFFSQGGVVIYKREYGYPSISGNALAIINNEKLVLCGYLNTDMIVIRVNSDGSFDTTFSTDGVSAIASGGYSIGNAVAVQSDGSIIAAGLSTFHDQYSDSAVFLAKLTGH